MSQSSDANRKPTSEERRNSHSPRSSHGKGSAAERETRETKLAEILSDFEADIRAGNVPSVDQWALRHPDFAEEIRELFPSFLMLESTGDSIQDMPPAPPIPEAIGPYAILRELGRGGMGVVYLAEDPTLQRRIAVKIFHKKTPGDNRFMERFFREARAAGSLNHPHIVPLFESEQDSGIPYYTMQYIDGSPLDACLSQLRRHSPSKQARKNSGRILDLLDRTEAIGPHVSGFAGSGVRSPAPEHPLGASSVPADPEAIAKSTPSPSPGSQVQDRPHGDETHRQIPTGEFSDSPAASGFDLEWNECTRICREVGEALVHAHSVGILHRDVKPANILIDRQGKAWVSDFGLCQLAGESSMTEQGEIVGTLRYMAPEQLEGEPDERSDVYCLGLVLYELVTRQTAFPETRRARLIKQIVSVDPPRPRKVNPSIPRDLETIVLKATAKLPQQRYSSAAAFVRDLRAYEEGRPILARSPSAWYLATLLVRRHKLLTTVLLLSLLGGTVLTALYTKSLQEERELQARGQYSARLTATEASLNSGSVARGLEQLDLAPERYRGWEWYHLNARIDQSLSSVRLAPVAIDVMFSPDQRFVAVATVEGMHLLSVQSDELRLIKELRGAMTKVIWREDGESFLAFGQTGKLYEVPVAEDAEIVRLGSNPRLVVNAQFIDPERLVVGTHHGTVLERDPKDGSWDLLLRREANISGLEVNPSGTLWVSDVRGMATTGNAEMGWSEDRWLGHYAVTKSLHLPASNRTIFLGNDGAPYWQQVRADGELESNSSASPRPGFDLGTFEGNAADMLALSLSPDGSRLVAGGRDRIVNQWSAQTGENLARFTGQRGRIRAIDWSPDGTRIAIADDRGYVTLWHPRQAGGRMDLGYHFSDIVNLNVSSDGQLAMTSSRDGSLKLWDLRDTALTQSYWSAGAELKACGFMEEHGQVFAATINGEFVVWDQKTAEELFRSPRQDRKSPRFGYAQFSSSNSTLYITSFVARGERGTWFEGWDIPSNKQSQEWFLPDVIVTRFLIHEELDAIVAGTNAGTILVIDRNSHKIRKTIRAIPKGKPVRLLFAEPDTRRIIIVNWTQSCYLLDLDERDPVREFTHSGAVIHTAEFLPGQNRLVGGTRSGNISLWNLTTGEHMTEIDTLPNWIGSLGCDSTGSTILTGTSHGMVRRYDTKNTSQRLAEQSADRDRVHGISRLDHGDLSVAATLEQLKNNGRHGYLAASLLSRWFSIRNHDLRSNSCLHGAVAVYRQKWDRAKTFLEDYLGKNPRDSEITGHARVLLYLTYELGGGAVNFPIELTSEDRVNLESWRTSIESAKAHSPKRK